MARVNEVSQFYLPPTRLSTSGIQPYLPLLTSTCMQTKAAAEQKGGRFFVQQPLKKGKGSRDSFKLLH